MKFSFIAVILTLGLGPWLWPLLTFSLKIDLYSHIILIPAVSVYLLWVKREQLVGGSRPLWYWAWLPFGLGAGALGLQIWGGLTAVPDVMASAAFTYVMFLWAAGFVTVGRTNLRVVAFPFVFLLAMVPFPVALENSIESILQHGSAECAYWLFRIAGTTVYREGLVFHLPSITMEVAPQCSGIRSSLVLFIVSLVGGQMFLTSNWRRLILVLAVLPLALLRNGFRVFTLGELCEKVGPHMIDSWVHHRGGPIFFALSLIPFMGLVWWLMRGEAKSKLKPVKAGS